MGSSRLPNKIMAEINGNPMIYWILERIKKSKLIDEIIIATTITKRDDLFCEWIRNKTSYKLYRGSENDVLERYYKSAKKYSADIIVRITADDPLKDYKVIDRAIKIIINNTNLDYCSNTIIPTYPEGLDVEVMNFTALEKSHFNAVLESEREHVTAFITNNPDIFSIKNFKYKVDLSKWRWTVDKPRDLDFIKIIYKKFEKNPLVDFEKIIEFLNCNPEYLKINEGTIRMEGYLKSVKEEQNDV